MYIHVVKPPDHAAFITLIWQISLMRVNWQTDQRPHGKAGPALEASLADHPTAATKERKRKRCGWSLFAFVIFWVLLYDLISFSQLKCWNYCNISDWKFTPSFLKIINFFFIFNAISRLKQILIMTIYIFKLEYKEINIVHLYMYGNNVLHATDNIPYRRVRQCQHTRMRVITMQ